MSISRIYTGNVVYGRLPQGCRLCLRGLKSVVFITGVCPRDCFYCPISYEKKGRDLIYINERPVKSLNEVVSEVALSGSRGVGVTGGDPLLRLDKTLETLKILRETFGKSFHIHLYTSGKTLSAQVLALLGGAGLDELRIHPDPLDVERILHVLKTSAPPFSVGFEVPAIPDRIDENLRLVEKAATCDAVEFVNINELEFSESNSQELRRRGYELSDNWRSARGSREAALRVVEVAEARGYSINVHFCPASSKDSYQMRLRLYRRGVMSARPHELVSDEGTIMKAIVPETCDSIPPLLVFRGRLGSETSLVLAEIVGAQHNLLEELPDFRRTLLNVA